jgi:hypothetical protein
MAVQVVPATSAQSGVPLGLQYFVQWYGAAPVVVMQP